MPASIDSVYENKKKLNMYHRNVWKNDKGPSQNKSVLVIQKSAKNSLADKLTKGSLVSQHNPRFLSPSDLANWFSSSKKLDHYKSMKKINNFSQKLHNASNVTILKDANSTRASKRNVENMMDFDQAYRMTTKKNFNSTSINDISGYATKSRRNYVENCWKVKNSSNTILQDLRHGEDPLCLSDDELYPDAEKGPSTNACSKGDSHNLEEKANKLSKCKSYHERPQDKNDLSVSTYQNKKKRTRLGTSPEVDWKSKQMSKNTYTSQVS